MKIAVSVKEIAAGTSLEMASWSTGHRGRAPRGPRARSHARHRTLLAYLEDPTLPRSPSLLFSLICLPRTVALQPWPAGGAHYHRLPSLLRHSSTLAANTSALTLVGHASSTFLGRRSRAPSLPHSFSPPALRSRMAGPPQATAG